MINYHTEKVPLVDRKNLFGDYADKFPKTLLIFKVNNSPMALEIDQVVNFLDLNIKQFFPVEFVTGEGYHGPIQHIAILDNKPVFVLNSQSSTLWPLTT